MAWLAWGNARARIITFSLALGPEALLAQMSSRHDTRALGLLVRLGLLNMTRKERPSTPEQRNSSIVQTSGAGAKATAGLAPAPDLDCRVES